MSVVWWHSEWAIWPSLGRGCVAALHFSQAYLTYDYARCQPGRRERQHVENPATPIIVNVVANGSDVNIPGSARY
jgi:hypothetical protein